jgi:hypothetical protein
MRLTTVRELVRRSALEARRVGATVLFGRGV